MKITVINGSPKRGCSDVLKATLSFIDGMNDFEKQEVTMLNAIDLDVKYCKGCLNCLKGGTCALHDEMPSVLDAVRKSDLVIFSFPLYCYGMPAPLKAVVDRLLPLSTIKMVKSGDRYVHEESGDGIKTRFLMISGCGFPNSKHNFEPAREQFELLFPMRNDILTVSEAPMLGVKEAEPLAKIKLGQFRTAGKIFAETKRLPEEIVQKIAVPMIPEEEYAKMVNGL